MNIVCICKVNRYGIYLPMVPEKKLNGSNLETETNLFYRIWTCLTRRGGR